MKKPTTKRICQLVHDNGKNVSSRVAEEFDISRQAASAWLARLKRQGILSSVGTGRGTTYSLVSTHVARREFKRDGLSEDVVWRELGAPIVADLPENVRGIWHHGITEMVNNAIDHSGSDTVIIDMKRNALFTQCCVKDNGEGIFLKIQKAMDLYDTREAILELAKGKFTTDPANHSGEGIFFSSKMFDRFIIFSGMLSFLHTGNDTPDVLFAEDDISKNENGTLVIMRLENDSSRTSKEVFDKFAGAEDYSFAKTVVPVKLAQHEGENLVSRSQAKRLARRFERFNTVVLDFAGVAEIGQAFADELFRVFSVAHPKVTMIPMHTSPEVQAMIDRVSAHS